jgi:nucleolar complex protein 2
MGASKRTKKFAKSGALGAAIKKRHQKRSYADLKKQKKPKGEDEDEPKRSKHNPQDERELNAKFNLEKKNSKGNDKLAFDYRCYVDTTCIYVNNINCTFNEQHLLAIEEMNVDEFLSGGFLENDNEENADDDNDDDDEVGDDGDGKEEEDGGDEDTVRSEDEDDTFNEADLEHLKTSGILNCVVVCSH